MPYPQILQNERSDTFHRQQESRDSEKPLSCLLFSSFRADRYSLGSLRSQDSGCCRNGRSLKISPDAQSMRIPCQSPPPSFFSSQNPLFWNESSLGPLCTNRILLDLKQLILENWVCVMLEQEGLCAFIPLSNKETNVELILPCIFFLGVGSSFFAVWPQHRQAVNFFSGLPGDCKSMQRGFSPG